MPSGVPHSRAGAGVRRSGATRYQEEAHDPERPDQRPEELVAQTPDLGQPEPHDAEDPTDPNENATEKQKDRNEVVDRPTLRHVFCFDDLSRKL